MICADTIRPSSFSLLNWKMLEPTVGGQIFWHIVNFTPDLPKHKTILAFTNAFSTWNHELDQVSPQGRLITLSPTDDFYQAHIRIFFMDPGKKEQEYPLEDGSTYILRNDWPFMGPGGVLAHRPPNKHELHFDESENWAEMHKPGSIDLLAVVMHEIGHLLDLGHSNKQSIMAPTYTPNEINLYEDDRAALRKRWGPVKQQLRHGKRKRRCWHR